MKFNTYLTELMVAKGIPKAHLARAIDRSETYVYYLCSGAKPPPKPEMMDKIASALRCSPAEKQKLTQYSYEKALGSSEHASKAMDSGIDYFTPTKGFKPIPLLGACPASAKQWTADEVVEWHELPEKTVNGKRMYLLKVFGDSMNRAGIDDGDFILVDADRIPENGQIAVACVDHEYTIKRFHKTNEKLTLSPDSTNQSHAPMVFDASADIHLRGVVHAIYLKRVK